MLSPFLVRDFIKSISRKAAKTPRKNFAALRLGVIN